MPYNLSRDVVQLLECEACELIYLDPELTREDFKAIYEDATQFASYEYRAEERVFAAMNYYTSCYRKMIDMMYPGKGTYRVLEIVAGLAWICRAAKQVGNAITVAQDISAECRSECSWVDRYIVGEMSNALVRESGPYDVISLTHVIEHLLDPVGALQFLSELLACDNLWDLRDVAPIRHYASRARIARYDAVQEARLVIIEYFGVLLLTNFIK